MLQLDYKPIADKVKCWDGAVVDIGDPAEFIATLMMRIKSDSLCTYPAINVMLELLGRTERIIVAPDENGQMTARKPDGMPPAGWFMNLYSKLRERLKQLEKQPDLALYGPLEPSYLPLSEEVVDPAGRVIAIGDMMEFYAKIRAQAGPDMFYDQNWANFVRLELHEKIVAPDDAGSNGALPVKWCISLMEAVTRRIAEVIDLKKK